MFQTRASLLGLLFAATTPFTASANPGDLDPTFGSNGTVLIFPGIGADASALVLQPDGKLVAAGLIFSSTRFGLARFNDDGSLDSSFGSGGQVSTPIPGGATGLEELVLQSDGKLVAAGGATAGGNSDVALARYNDDGTLDPTFGTGGIAIGPALSGHQVAKGLALQSDGKLVVATAATGGAEFIVVRYEDDGTIDTGFGTGGVATVTVGAGATPSCVVVQPDGMIVVGGTLVTTDAVPVLARFDSAGAVDFMFGVGGIATAFSGYVTSLLIDPAGKLVASGGTGDSGFGPPPSPTDLAGFRWNPDGTLYDDFGVSVGAIGAIANGLVLESDGRIIVAGLNVESAMITTFALARFNADGTVHNAFGMSGVVLEPGGPLDPRAYAIVRQPDGKVVVAGGMAEPFFAGRTFLLARYETTGSFCGDEVIDPGETCDDGNTLPGDCCSPTCILNAPGTPCLDSTVCNGQEACDGAGECMPGTPLECGDDNRCTRDWCDQYAGCVYDDTPIDYGQCKSAEKSTLVIKDDDDDQRDKLIWKWRKGDSTTLAELGDPSDTTIYTLCLYAGGELLDHLTIPAHAMRWSAKGTSGFAYDDPTGAADGVLKGLLKSGDAGKAKAFFKAKGPALPDGLLPISGLPMAVQLLNSDTFACIGSTFDGADILETSATQFKAKIR